MKSVSVLIPTLNSGNVLAACLESIAWQQYPRDCLEIIVADGGSTDDTLAIARRYTDKVHANPLRTGEAGKAVALKHANGEIVAFIDSDNILPQSDWLAKMTQPFEDPEIVGAEPLHYVRRAEDGYTTRYCALMGMNDPLCLFLGNYDRENAITGKWTEMPVAVREQDTYLKIELDERRLPTIGANGFLARRRALEDCTIRDYLFDIDVVYELLKKGKPKFAKVKIGIIHVFSGDVRTFARKQLRRVRDYMYYSRSGLRTYPWKTVSGWRLAKFIVYCFLILPVLIQAAVGYWRKPDRAWLFHPVACWITLLVYAYGTVRGLILPQAQDRTKWGQ